MPLTLRLALASSCVYAALGWLVCRCASRTGPCVLIRALVSSAILLSVTRYRLRATDGGPQYRTKAAAQPDRA